MAGYLRKLISLENALKNAINDLKDDGLKKATGKSASHFRKCTDVIIRITIFIIKIL